MRSRDRQLVRRLKANDHSAFEEVVERHYQPIFRQLWRLCGDSDTAADLTQETFVQAWRSLPTFEGRSALGTWLHTIAVRAWRRWHERQPNLDPLPLDALDELLPGEAHDPAGEVEARLQNEEIKAALLRLPPDYREALVLFYMEGLKYREIAERLSIPLGTVKSRLHTGLLRLRAVLAAGAGDPLPCPGRPEHLNPRRLPCE